MFTHTINQKQHKQDICNVSVHFQQADEMRQFDVSTLEVIRRAVLVTAASLRFGLLTVSMFATTLSMATPAHSAERIGQIALPLSPALSPVRMPAVAGPAQFFLNRAFCDIASHPVSEPSGGIEFPGPEAGQPGNGEIRAWQPASGRPLVSYSLSSYPNAVCNDGSPARMYVRAAPAMLGGKPNPHKHKWHVHLKGGGSCDSWRSCAERWCDAPKVDPVTGAATPKELNNPGLMSSRGMPTWAQAHGMFFDDPRNQFSHYNQVLVAYCSSDRWIGNQGGVSVVSIDPLDDGKHASIQFRGKAIVDAVFHSLLQLGGLTFMSSDPQSDQQIEVRLPSMRHADQLVFSGDSAGANGVRSHIDRIRDALIAQTAGDKPLVLGAFDAGGSPDMTDARIDWSVHPLLSYSAFMNQRFDQAVSFHGVTDAALDKSCVNAFGFDSSCIDFTRVLQNHVTTDSFQRTSLRDALTKKSLVNSGMVANPGVLRDLTRDGLHALTVPGLEARNPISVVGQDSTQHVTYRGNQYYSLRTLAGRSTAEHLQRWVQQCEAGNCNSGPGLIIDID